MNMETDNLHLQDMNVVILKQRYDFVMAIPEIEEVRSLYDDIQNTMELNLEAMNEANKAYASVINTPYEKTVQEQFTLMTCNMEDLFVLRSNLEERFLSEEKKQEIQEKRNSGIVTLVETALNQIPKEMNLLEEEIGDSLIDSYQESKNNANQTRGYTYGN